MNIKQLKSNKLIVNIVKTLLDNDAFYNDVNQYERNICR